MSLGHVVGLFSHPDQEWEAIRQENESIPKLYLSHVFILAFIPAICAFYGTTQVGWQVGDSEFYKLTTTSAIQLSVLFYGAMLVGIFVIGQFIDFFARTFGADPAKHQGVILASYTASPLFLVGLFLLYPDLWVNMLAGFIALAYSVYLLYEGIPILMKIPPERGFIFATSVATVGLVMLTGLFAISVIIWSMGIGPVYTS